LENHEQRRNRQGHDYIDAVENELELEEAGSAGFWRCRLGERFWKRETTFFKVILWLSIIPSSRFSKRIQSVNNLAIRFELRMLVSNSVIPKLKPLKPPT
jgi:hypothetical protein